MVSRELTLDECETLLRCDGTLEQAQEGWVFDYRKIDTALTFLKITHRVKLGFKAGLWKYGHHDSSSGIHIIRITTYLDIEDANESLWHELVHASQAERLLRQDRVPIARFHLAYQNAMGPPGSMYRDNSFELEATYLASRYKNMALLA